MRSRQRAEPTPLATRSLEAYVTPPQERLLAFSYLTAERAPLYRAILSVFVEARQRFALHLRPEEIDQAIEVPDTTKVESALRQLVEWGNLEAHQDTTEVATVEEFYRPRYLFQLTARGEAAEHAVRLYESELQQKGELKIAALQDVRALLNDLLSHARQEEPDPGKVFLTLQSLHARFEELTRRAQAFMRSLQRSIDLLALEEESLLAYKESLIEYLERFVRELVTSGSEIARSLDELDRLGVERLLELAALREASDAAPDVAEEDLARALATSHQAWAGLQTWFRRGAQGEPSQAEILRSQAMGAIPAFLAAISGLNDRRVSRSDRASDLKSLARWFAETDCEVDAHRLWRAAFGLSSSRHLRVTADTIDAWADSPVSPHTSWLEAPPIEVSPRLRATGRTRRPGRANRVIDRSAEKAQLAERAAEEARQLDAARAVLATGERTRLAQLPELDPQAFDLFLDLLGQALAAKTSPDEPVRVTSTDGSLVVELEPTRDGRIAEVQATAGVLTGPDHWLTIRDALAVS